MGGCISSSSSSGGDQVANKLSTVHVISLKGDLRDYYVPVTVSDVLQSEGSSLSCFVCNSDRLYFGDYIPSLNIDDELEAGQIYFVLPRAKLQFKLSASDMAALAVKASIALDKSSNSTRRRKNKKARISPVILDIQEQEAQEETNGYDYNQSQKDGLFPHNKNNAPGLGVSRSRSVRKLQKYSSRKAKIAVRSFRLRLSTIYEGSVLYYN